MPHNLGAMSRSSSRPPAAGKTVQRRRAVSCALVESKRRSGCAQRRGARHRSAAAVFPPYGLSASGPRHGGRSGRVSRMPWSDKSTSVGEDHDLDAVGDLGLVNA